MTKRTKRELEIENAELRGRVAALEQIVEAYRRPITLTPHAQQQWPVWRTSVPRVHPDAKDRIYRSSTACLSRRSD